jgi:hypothetical protein
MMIIDAGIANPNPTCDGDYTTLRLRFLEVLTLNGTATKLMRQNDT